MLQLPKSVLKVQRASLRSKSTQVLEDMLAHQKNELAKLAQNSNKSTYQYLHFSIEQKISLIEDELKLREQEVTSSI